MSASREERLRQVAQAFIDYYAKRDDRGGHCSNCGGLPHSATCFVKRFEDVLREAAAPAAEPEP